MKEYLEKMLPALRLKIATEEQKEEAKKNFLIKEVNSILYFREEYKGYNFAITDLGIYYELDNRGVLFETLFDRYYKEKKEDVFHLYGTLYISWYEIESINNKYINIKGINYNVFTFLVKGNKKYNIYLTLDSERLGAIFRFILIERVRIKIEQSLSKNNIKEAEMFLKYFEVNREEAIKNEELMRYIDYISLSIKVYEKSNNFYKVAQIYEELEEFKKGDLEAFSKYNKEKEESYRKYIDYFKKLPLRERNIITISDTEKLFRSDHITLLNINQLPAINFPMSRPKVNQTYIAHPYKTDSYLPIESYDYELLYDRMDEFCYILRCLGATSITIETIKKENKEDIKKLNVAVNVGGSKELVEDEDNKKGNIGGEIGVRYKRAANTSLSKYIGLERVQTFNPKRRPYIPNNLIWFPHELRWQHLAQQRLEGGILTYIESVSSSDNQLLKEEEMVDVNAELKMLLLSIKAGVQYEKNIELQQNEEFSFSIKIEFKPMEEFPEETEIIDIMAEEVTQTPIQLTASNDNEARYLEEIHIMLEDDGVIDERERMILERIRERYNITPERARELEAQAIAGQELTSEEKEYLSEYKSSLHDGAISDKERRLLNRLAMALGISEERVKELERNV